jgi:histidinol-phosphate aminotransferase
LRVVAKRSSPDRAPAAGSHAIATARAANPWLELAAPGVRKLKPYQPGKPIAELEREYGVHNVLKLASNENLLGPSPLAVEAMRQLAPDIWLYPDGSGFQLKAALAARHGVSPSWITLGNGSNDVLVLLAEAFLTADVEAIYSQYAFAVYPIAVQAAGARASVAPAYPPYHPMALGHDLDAMAARLNARTRLIYVANPNNPTGTWLPRAALRAFLDAVPAHALAVVDEAYSEYVEEADYPNAVEWIAHYPNLVVTRTFSKIFGLAGVRVGYAVSRPEVADVLNRVRQAFNVNALAQAAACAALRDREHLARAREMNARGLRELATVADELGLRHPPSVGNFLLLDFQRPARPLYEALLREGIITRPLANYELPQHLRVTIGRPEHIARVAAALRKLLRPPR